MNEENLLAMILTHGRPDAVHICNSLIRQGWTGPICILIDDEDKAADQYRERFGDMVQIFNKKEWVEKTDSGDNNLENRKAIVYARNASYEIARKLGFRYFIQLDDDYTSFSYRENNNGDFTTGGKPRNMQKTCGHLLDFFKRSKARAVSIAQTGDFIGGDKGSMFRDGLGIKRKCMNFWFCDTESPMSFSGRLNEDCSRYCEYGFRGELYFQIRAIALNQVTTQKAKGGMSEAYSESGTYIKSFHTVMRCPSFVKVSVLQTKNKRLHHKINWENACPKIIRESVRKL